MEVNETDVVIAVRRREAPGPVAALAGVADADVFVPFELGEELDDGGFRGCNFREKWEKEGKSFKRSGKLDWPGFGLICSFVRNHASMNIAEIKLNLFRNIDRLPEKMLLELRALIDDFLAKKQQQIPKPQQQKPRQFGCMKGLVIYMADDFDAPLEDFKDYM